MLALLSCFTGNDDTESVCYVCVLIKPTSILSVNVTLSEDDGLIATVL